MIGETQQKPILIYFKIRGHAQVIRCLLLELQVDFQEINVTNEGYLDPTLVSTYKIEMQNLPYLIHNGHAFREIMPIMKYLCIHYNRGDLLGKTLTDSIRILQILVKYMKEKNNTLSVLRQGLLEIGGKQLGEEAYEKLSEMLVQIAEKTKYCQATDRMFLQTKQYLCGYLTILDFIFYEKCFYYANLKTNKIEPQGPIAVKYVEFFESTPFYSKNKEFLEKYKIFVERDQQITTVLDKMWLGSKKFVK